MHGYDVHMVVNTRVLLEDSCNEAEAGKDWLSRRAPGIEQENGPQVFVVELSYKYSFQPINECHWRSAAAKAGSVDGCWRMVVANEREEQVRLVQTGLSLVRRLTDAPCVQNFHFHHLTLCKPIKSKVMIQIQR